MNLYLRYFSEETLVHSVEEAVAFLTSLADFKVSSNMVNDLRQFAESPVSYPKRYKIRPRVYFIVIKTTANTMEEFKANNKKNNHPVSDNIGDMSVAHKNERQAELAEEKKGWYEGSIMFKRVIPIQGTGKFQYKDTLFVARCKANSPLHCYERIVQHLRNRQDVDLRSQFPSAKGKNFSYTYLGETLPA